MNEFVYQSSSRCFPAALGCFHASFRAGGWPGVDPESEFFPSASPPAATGAAREEAGGERPDLLGEVAEVNPPPQDLMSTESAALIYQGLTGRAICPRYLETRLYIFRHLGYFAQFEGGEVPILLGVRGRAFHYFVKTRLVLRGPGHVFSAI